MHEDEQRAVAMLRRGDIRGLEALVRLHQLRAVRTAFGITGDRQTAEDVVADAFLAVYDRIGTYDQRRPFGPWFYRIVVNGALKAVERQRRVVALVPETAAAGPDLEATVLRHEAEAEVRGALAALPAEQRATVVLRYYLDMSEAEIAETLGCATGTVKWRLHAAKARMQRGWRRGTMRNDDLTRHLEAGVPDDVDLWPKIQAQLEQQRRPDGAPGRAQKRRWSIGAVAAAAVLVVGIGLTGTFWPLSVSAQLILDRAQAALAAPVANGFTTLTLQETVTDQSGTSEISRWYEAPNRWRVEVSAGGKLQNLVVSDGKDMWNYDPQQKSVSVSDAAPNYGNLADLSPLGEKTESLADLLAQASRCFSPKVAGSETVAGRGAYVVELTQTSCFSASISDQGGTQTLWVDKQTYLVLKHVIKGRSGVMVQTREVTSIAYDAPIPAGTFSFTVPDGVTVWDQRSKPAPSGFEDLVAQMQQLAKASDYPVFLPRAVPKGLIAGAPQHTPAGIEVAYSPTGTFSLEAGTVLVMQRKATPSDLGGHPPDEQPMQVGGYPGWLLEGYRNADGTGLATNLTLVRDGTRITFSSFELGKEQLMSMALSLEQVPGSHAPLPNPAPSTLGELRAQKGYPILVPTKVPAGLTAKPPISDYSAVTVRLIYVDASGTIGLDVLIGPAGCCLDADGRKGGEPVTIRNGITGHFLNIEPEYGGPILWWQEDGAYVAIAGPHLGRTDLIDIANSMSATANP